VLVLALALLVVLVLGKCCAETFKPTQHPALCYRVANIPPI
jgi:hypothetical protein